MIASIAMGWHSSAPVKHALEMGYGIWAKSVGFKTRRYHLLIRHRFSKSIPFCEFIFLLRRNRRGTKWHSSQGMDSMVGRLQ